MDIISYKDMPRDVGFLCVNAITQSWFKRKSWSFIGNPRPNHGFIYVLCDKVQLEFRDGSRSEFDQGDLIYLPKYSEYIAVFVGGKPSIATDTICFTYDIKDANGLDHAFSVRPFCIANQLPAKLISKMLTITDICKNLANPTIAATKMFYEMFEDLLKHIRQTEISTSTVSVLPALQYIESHISESFPVSELAKMCRLGEPAFRHTFFEHTGQNPLQYIINTKINKAKQLLSGTQCISTEEIAAALGFYDNAYFHKMFIKYTGMTPKQYRTKSY